MDKTHLIGQACALATAFTWAFALVMFKRSGETIRPMPLNMFKNVIGLLLLLLTLAVMPGQQFGVPAGLSQMDVWILVFSGVVGIALADSIFLAALNMIGVGLTSIVDCMYSPSAILFACLLLGEVLTEFHYIGAAMIIVGVFVSSRHKPPEGRTRGQLVGGMALAALSVMMMAFGIVIAKPVLAACPLVWATAVRLGAGTVVLAALAAVSPRRREYLDAFRPAPSWKYAVPGSVLGTYVCLILWIAGFKYTYASVAAVLNQTSAAFALILATVILKERFTKRKLVSVILAMSGVIVVTQGGWLSAWLGSWLSATPAVTPGG